MRAGVHIQPIAFGESFNLNLQSQSQSHWSLYNGMRQKRPRELDYQLKFEKEEMTLQTQYAVRGSQISIDSQVL